MHWPALLVALLLVSGPACAQGSSAVFGATSAQHSDFSVVPRIAIPAEVVKAIQAAPTKSRFGVAGYVPYREQVLKAEVLTFNARSLLEFQQASVPFLAIAAKDLYIEIPATRDEVAKISRAPDAAFGNLNGRKGDGGIPGRSSGRDDGAHGGNGGPGGTGEAGRTAAIPTIYVFFQRAHTTTGNPATSGLLRFLMDGVPGGSGGEGGPGGNGGNGARGQPSECNVLECRAGPGIGGNGGAGGSGGRGGDAGAGGIGGVVVLAGPKTDWQYAAFFEIRNEGGRAGLPGSPGRPGSPGYAGDGGTRCYACNFREGGKPGRRAQPPDLGAGAKATDGLRGEQGLVDRANDDLF